MSFGTNLQYLRKQHCFTQETLADQLGVSRQTVSKWESDLSFPEMEKILQLCDLFSCSMDALIREDLEKNSEQEEPEADQKQERREYEEARRRLTRSICIGVPALLVGITLMLICDLLGLNEAIGRMVFFLFLIFSAIFCIVGGMEYAGFTKRHPLLSFSYSEEEQLKFDRKFPFLIVIPISLILIGVVILMCSEAIPRISVFSKEQWETLFLLPRMVFLAISCCMFIYAGMEKSRFNIAEYNKEHSPDEKTRRQNEVTGRWSGIIFIIAIAAYLVMGFVGELWGTAWVIFPVAALFCGIVSIAAHK